MNSIELALLNHNYKNKRLNKYKFLYRRTNKKRIKNKIFSILLSSLIKEKKIIFVDEIVMMDINYFVELEEVAKCIGVEI